MGRMRIFSGYVVALGIAFLGFAAQVQATGTPGRAVPTSVAPGLFGSSEWRRSSFTAFAQWREMLLRYEAETENDYDCSTLTFVMRCGFENWRTTLEEISNQPFDERLDAVNRYVNRALYVSDQRNWGVPDYWATPGEFLHKDGDCEDYAIVKYLSLKDLHVPPEAMRIVVLEDTNLSAIHAVLAVYSNDRWYILDNQVPYVVEADSIFHYRPIYSINETAWWLHRD